MPYIKKDRRLLLDPAISELKEKMRSLDNLSKGDLNYICYSLGLSYIKTKGPSYQNISDAVDGIRGSSTELSRRILDPYEDTKIVENGDIQ
jgi:hypothetical protein